MTEDTKVEETQVNELKLEELSVEEVAQALETVEQPVELSEVDLKTQEALKKLNPQLIMAKFYKSNTNWKRKFMYGQPKKKIQQFWHNGELISAEEHDKLSFEERYNGSRFNKKDQK